MKGIRFFFPPALAPLAIVALAAILAVVPWDGGRTAHADTFSQSFDVVLCDGTSAPNDATCATAVGTTYGNNNGIIEKDESPEVRTTIKLDYLTPLVADEPFFDLADTLLSGLTPAYGAAIADGAWTGSMTFSIESNLITPTTSNVLPLTGQPPKCAAGIATLEATFSLFDADLGTGSDVDHGLGAGLISEQDLDGDGLRETEEDNYDGFGRSAGQGGGPNGLYDGIDLLPDALANYLIPSLGLGSPIARSFGVARIAPAYSVTTDVNFLLYHLGGGEYLTLTVLGYPGLPRQQPSAATLTGQTVVTCPPFSSTIRLFGKIQDNSVPCCEGSPNPSILGGNHNWTALLGTHSSEILVSTGDNYDGDAAAGPYDSCPAVVSVNTDLPGGANPDSDRWDSACDPFPASFDNDNSGTQMSYNLPGWGTWPLDPQNCNVTALGLAGGWDCDQDVDGDGTLNTVDNCPFTPDADVSGDTVVDWQLDSDADGVGNVCDPAPKIKGDGSGYAIDAHPHGFFGEPGGYGDHDRICNDEFAVPGTEGANDAVCVDTVDSGNDGDPDFLDRDGDTAYDIGEPLDADSDADGDGYSDACEAVRGSDPLDASSIPPGPSSPADCDSDGASDDDEEVVGANLWMNDSDGDGCADGEEWGPNKALGGQRNPANPYDFYDITNLTGVVGAKDKAVAPADLSMLLSYGGTRAGGPPNVAGKSYDADTNGNTIPDGREIDKAGIAGPGTGPDGGIGPADLNDLLSQAGNSCVRPP